MGKEMYFYIIENPRKATDEELLSAYEITRLFYEALKDIETEQNKKTILYVLSMLREHILKRMALGAGCE